MSNSTHIDHAEPPSARVADGPARSLTVVIPAYNESRRIGPSLERVRAWAEATGRSVEVLVVDDGSSDATADAAARLAAGRLRLRVIRLDRNRGKGAAVRRGMLEATGERVLMCDADLSTPIEEISKLERAVDAGCDIAIGSRDLPDSRLDPPQAPARRLLAWTFRAVRRRLLLREIRDTQCGFKLFTRDAAREVFARATVDGWLFDCEALAIAERLGLRIREVGVVWRNHPDSRVIVAHSLLTSLPQLLAIRRRVRGIALPE